VLLSGEPMRVQWSANWDDNLGGGAEVSTRDPIVERVRREAEDKVRFALLQDHRAGVEMLRLALQAAGSPYAAVAEAVCGLLPGPSPADEAAARRLARAGPPTETVGLEPFSLTPRGGS
jgi:nitrate reductase delta subunit